jgi:hypothetical protein
MELELTDEQADKLNRALAGEEVELTDAEAQLLSQAMGQSPGVPAAPREPKANMAESALQGFGQGASFGFADELGGVAHEGVARTSSALLSLLKTGPGRAIVRAQLGDKGKHLPDAAIDAIVDEAGDDAAHTVLGVQPRSAGGGGLPSAGYSAGRDQSRQAVKEAQESNPKTFFAGNVAGALAVPMPGSGAAKPFQTVIARSLENAAKFGAQGAVAGLGSSDADLLKGEFGDAAIDTAIGGGAGAGMGFLTGPAAYTWARHARPALQKLAQSRAVAAIAPTAGLANRLRKAGYSSEPELQQLGKDVLELGVLKPFGTAAGAQERTAGIMASEGANIGSALDKADDLVEQGVATGPSRDLQRQAVTRELARAADTPATQAKLPGVEGKLLESVGEDNLAAKPASFRELWKNKSQLQSVLKPDEFSSLEQKLYRQGVRGYTGGVYNQLEGAIGPDAIEGVRESAKKYGTAASIDDLLREQVTRAAAHQPISLGDAARGAAFEGVTPGGSSVGTLISSLLRGRTDSTIATAANHLAKVRQPALPVGRLSKAYAAMLQQYGLGEEQR